MRLVGERLSTLDRSRIVLLAGQGLSVRRIARQLHCTRDTVRLWLQRHAQTGDVEPSKKSGRPRLTTPAQDRLIVQTGVRHRRLGVRKLVERVPAGFATAPSATTIWRRISAAGYKFLGVQKKPMLTEAHKQKRLAWARARKRERWDRVLFGDEATVFLVHNQRRVRRLPGERYFVVRPKHPAKVNLFLCGARAGQGDIFLFTENLTGPLYARILREHVPQSAATIFGRDDHDWLWLHDRDPKSQSRVAQDETERLGIRSIDFPANSPDLNIAEQLINSLKDAVDKRNPSTVDGLKRCIREEWANLSHTTFENLVDSMPRRISDAIAARGGVTDW